MVLNRVQAFLWKYKSEGRILGELTGCQCELFCFCSLALQLLFSKLQTESRA